MELAARLIKMQQLSSSALSEPCYADDLRSSRVLKNTKGSSADSALLTERLNRPGNKALFQQRAWAARMAASSRYLKDRQHGGG